MSIFVPNNTVNEDRKFTPEVLWQLGRISSPSISHDGNLLVYSVKYFKTSENKGVEQFYTIEANGSNKKMITNSDTPKTSPKFLNNGKIAFLQHDPETKQMQLFQMDADGSNQQIISHVETGIDDFLFSPDNTKVIYVTQVKNIPTVQELHPDLDKSNALIATDLMFQHWDKWMETVPHPFVADFDGTSLSEPFDILNGTKFECPLCPFNSISDLCWSPDGKHIVYVMKPSIGIEYAFKTRMDLYLYDVKTKWSDNLTPDADHGMLFTPVYSPDSQKVAYGRMRRDGYESDVIELFVYDFNKKDSYRVNKQFPETVNDFCWGSDSKTLFFTAILKGHTLLYKLLEDGKHEEIVTPEFDYCSIHFVNNRIYSIRSSNLSPQDIVSIDPQTKQIIQITFENKEIMDQIELGKVEERLVDSHDGKKIHCYVFYPPNFDKSKKYPGILFCSGGPEGMISNNWHYRWHYPVMAAGLNGVIIAPNRRGCTGFGLEWREDVILHFGGNAQKDLLSAIDALAKEPFIDENRLGCMGASYGGYSVFYLESHHEKRFNAFVAHDGLLSFTQTYLETEEMWFAEKDIGAPWDIGKKPGIDESYEGDPIRYLDKWDTPILVIHGEKDYRLRSSQGIQAFNAARMRGIPAKLLLFPTENHWCSSPQNSILWYRTIVDWLNQYLA
ncbi:peptidase [Tritrichomonas foetus]|uniref:Peptidase n=1 Tax=Tritrichomonas foetus TaxID=1144522 RepID=A0A1J4JKL9_9EUKA|nr:peptidase [Tritrichomonas foetus]|eukprot:OHS98109.1 peptidase [Tritrichomonas foetus]